MTPYPPVTTELDPALALAAAARAGSAAGAGRAAWRQALAMVADEGFARPVFCFRTLEILRCDGETLELGPDPSSLPVPELARLAGRLKAVTAAACTLGPALEARVSELCAARRMSLAHALDGVGNAMLMYTARCAAHAVRRSFRGLGLTTGDPLSPGGRGIRLDLQGAVLELAGAERLGVSATLQGMLSPVKSRTLLVGAGTGLRAQPFRRRCESCPSAAGCRYRPPAPDRVGAGRVSTTG